MTRKQKVLARLEQGQSLLIIGVVMVGLIALMGLAIDGGNLFMQRRRAQNAADAVALAATQVLAKAFCDDTVTENDVEAAIAQYAESHDMNSVDTTILADYVEDDGTVIRAVGDPPGRIPIGTQGISVTVASDYATYFVVIVGVDTAAASAQATALTGQTRVVLGGLRPFGLPAEVVNADEGGVQTFTMCFGMQCDSGEDCTVEYLDDMGDQTAAHRGWINYNCIWYEGDPGHDPPYPRIDGDCDNVGVNDIKKWMRDGWDGPLYIDDPWWQDWYHPAALYDVAPIWPLTGLVAGTGSDIGDFVHASAGVAQSAIFVAEDLIQNPPLEILIPVYDVYMPYEATPIGHRPDPGASQGGNNYYHIVGATVIEITGTSTKHHCISGHISKLIVSQGELVEELLGYGEGGCASGILLVVLVD